jgi:hypothetical protein
LSFIFREQAQQIEFEDYKRDMMHTMRTKKVPLGWTNPDYEMWVCPLFRTLDDSRIKCPHPLGYHEWLDANPWVNKLIILQ